MTSGIAVVAALLLTGPSVHAEQAVSTSDVVGVWLCGPKVMKGPGITVTASFVFERRADMTFVETGETLVKPDDRPAFTFNASYSGSWKLDGSSLVMNTTEARFISSNNPM